MKDTANPTGFEPVPTKEDLAHAAAVALHPAPKMQGPRFRLPTLVSAHLGEGHTLRLTFEDWQFDFLLFNRVSVPAGTLVVARLFDRPVNIEVYLPNDAGKPVHRFLSAARLVSAVPRVVNGPN